MSRLSSLAAVCLVALVNTGCWEQVSREWFAQMKEQPAVQASECVQPFAGAVTVSSFHASQSSECNAPLAPPEGTVPVQGIMPRIGSDHPMAMTPMFSPEAGALVNPIAADADSVARGKHLYGVYCQVCHADDGLASPDKAPVAGLLAKSGAPPFPLSTTVAYSDGQIYTKIRYGKPLMPGYPQIPHEDRWHIVNYLRTLFRKG